MFSRFFGRDNRRSAGERFRRIHERWLTRALRSGIEYPRIPVRRVDEGGFEIVRSKPEARTRADRWWALALERVDSAPNPRFED